MPQRLTKTNKPRQVIPFVYASFRALTQELGAISGLSSGIVLATRALTEAAGLDEKEHRNFVIERAVHFQVNTRHLDFSTFETCTVQLLLVGVFQQSEAFVDGLSEERALMGAPWRSKPDKMSKLHHMMREVGEGFAVNSKRVGEEIFALLDYYRLMRNSFVHGRAELDELEKLYDQVKVYREHIRTDYGLNAPNHYDALTYDDFILASRAMRVLSISLCRLSEPKSAREIIALIINLTIAGSDVGNVLFRIRDNPTGLKAALRGWFKNRYDYWLEEYPSIENGVLAWVETVPPKGDRRRAGYRTLASHFRSHPFKGD